METRELIITTLRKHAISDDRKSFWILVFTVFLHVSLIGASAACFFVSPWLSVLFWLPIGALFCRFFVLEHDTGHYSFFKKRPHNRIACGILGLFSMLPSPLWNYIHDTHHGMLGNLNLRKHNPELWTMTVKEFEAAPPKTRLAYRFIRSKFMRLGITPFLWMVAPRIPFPMLGFKICASILLHDLIYGTLLYFLIVNQLFFAFVMVYLVPYYLFNVIASIFFYLQHNYENTHWESEPHWDLYNASINGSSHLVVGKMMRWVTGNVGCHHIHHLNTKIPSYRLYDATEEANKHLDISPIYLKNMLHHFNAVLWDEEEKRLISFKALARKNPVSG